MEAHEVLGVPKDASEHQIRVAYKTLAMKWHPDRQPQNREEATAKFVEINKANRTLLRNLRRARRMAQSSEGTAVSDESLPSSPQSSPQTSPQSSPQTSPQSSPRSTSSSLPESSTQSTPSSRSNSPFPNPKSSQPPSVFSFTSAESSPPRSSFSDEAGETRGRYSSRSPKSSNPSFKDVSPSHTSSNASLSSSPKPTGNKLRKQPRPSCKLDPETSKATPKTFSRCDSGCNPECMAETLRPVRAVLLGAGADAPKNWVHVLNMTLEEIYHGKTCHFRVIRYTRSGKKSILPLDVHVPPGSRGGTEIILEGVGNERKDGTWQDISFVVKEMKHDRFRRIHDDLVMDVRLPWVDNLNDQEGQVYLQGIDQTEYVFKVDYHSTRLLSGTAIILGAGMHCRDGAGRGRIVVRWEIATPLSSWDSIKNVLLFKS